MVVTFFKRALFLFFLFDQCLAQELVRTFTGHSSCALSVAFSPDGKQLLSGSEDYSMKRWDVSTGKCLQTYNEHSYGVHAVVFSPDGRFLLSRSRDHSIKFIDIATGHATKIFRGHTGAIYGLAFSPDGNYLVSGSADKTIKLWEIKSVKAILTFAGHGNGVRTIAFSPDGAQLLSSSWDKTIKLWDVRNGKCLRTLPGTASTPNIPFSPDGMHFLIAMEDHSFQLRDVQAGNMVQTFRGHTDAILSLALSPNGLYALSGSLDGTAKVWEISTGNCVHTFPKGSGGVASVAFSPDGKLIVTGTVDIRLWKMPMSLNNIVKRSVRKKMEAWQTRGKYESAEAYKTRVNENTISEKSAVLSQDVIDSLGNARAENFSVEHYEYDVDKQVFTLHLASPDIAPFELPVPAAEAENFENNIDKITFSKPRFSLSEQENILITYVEAFNLSNSGLYVSEEKEETLAKQIVSTNSPVPNQVDKEIKGGTIGKPPVLTLVQPRVERGKNYHHPEKKLTIKGSVKSESGLFILLVNGTETPVGTDGCFQCEVPLAYNENNIILKAIDRHNQVGLDSILVFRAFDNSAAIVEGRKGIDYALVIATDDYKSYKKLSNPINDGKAIAAELETNYGYKVELVQNPTRAELYTVLRSYSKRQFSDEDQLFIFIAGHGEFDQVFSEGYIVTTDSKSDDEIKESFISHSNVRTIINNIPCKHILLAMDVCFGGTFDQFIANTRGEEPHLSAEREKFIKRKLQLTTRKYLTSGGKEYVPDGRPGFHSPFAAKFLTALRTYGGEDKILTFNELYSIVDKAVPGPKTGEFGNNQPGSDFLFIAK